MSGRPKHIKLKVDGFSGQSDLPTEQEINEWTRRSRNHGICGIVNCFNKPTTKCKKCTNYYCSEHFAPHLDLLPDGNYIYSSSNGGLDHYMDESKSVITSSNERLDYHRNSDAT
jgi:hypothetical protein